MKPVIKEAIDKYAKEGYPVGGFLTAVLENKLREAFARADVDNLRDMHEIVKYCWWEIPGNCWGSEEKVREWLEGHALAGGGGHDQWCADAGGSGCGADRGLPPQPDGRLSPSLVGRRLWHRGLVGVGVFRVSYCGRRAAAVAEFARIRALRRPEFWRIQLPTIRGLP